METVMDDYFRGIFQSPDPSEESIEEALQFIPPRLMEVAAFLMNQPFSDIEVKNAIASMSPLKFPGPDGYPALFYQKYWNILENSVINCVLNCLNNIVLSPVLNRTFIVLIPRIRDHKRMSEFRSISLCNVLYKIGSKALANRLKPALDLLISLSLSLSPFVPNRLITDNFLVAFELNHYIRTKSPNKTDYMTLKLDVSKAYDRVG